MKKKFLLFSTLILMAITALNINLSSKRDNIFTMTLKSLESQAYDLPEVNVVCSTNDTGTCWTWEYDKDSTTTGNCIYTGYMADTCTRP